MDVGSRVMQDDSMDGGGRECLEHILEQLPSSCRAVAEERKLTPLWGMY